MANLYRVQYTRVWREPNKKFGSDSITATVLVSATTEANANAAAKSADSHGTDANFEYTYLTSTLMGNIIAGS